MKAHTRKVLAALIICLAALAFVGSAVAMPRIEVGGSASISSPSSQPLSPRPFGRGAPMITRADVQPVATSSGYDWGKTVGISAGAVALALCLSGLALVGVRQHKAQLGV
ncbi:MAG: hypothetical protein E6G42_06510 [Actinobacteria bacterium]|nr:MAG: hypothetical protein E6G42_06510 [Actinomycetota bacterium]